MEKTISRRMIKMIMAVALFAVTATAIWLTAGHGVSWAGSAVAPVNPNDNMVPVLNAHQQQPQVEVVFVLDTTSSMSGLIDSAKDKIWSIATGMAQAQPAPEIKMGLVAYRDRGDAYVTRVHDLSNDLDSMFVELMNLEAVGGGDGPESVNQALYEAVNQISWSAGTETYKVIFLVGDAPPHMDYANDVPFTESVRQAQQAGIVVNTIQCGNVGTTRQPWLSIAQLGGGRFFQVEQSGGAIAVSTPYDEDIARLAKDLDDTRLYYGDKETRERGERKKEIAELMRVEVTGSRLADRAAYNLTESGRANLLGDHELVDAVSKGEVDLSELDDASLPAPLREAAPEERQEKVAVLVQKRAELQVQLQELQKQRSQFLEAEAPAAPVSAWDQSVLDAVKEQSTDKGLHYEDKTDS